MKTTILILLLFISGLSMAQPGNALNFDGGNDVVVVPNDPILEFSNGTIEVWIKPDWVSGTAGYNPSFIGLRDASHSRFSFHIKNDYSTIDLYNGGAYSFSYPFSQGEWYHIALVFKNSSTDVYINGLYQGAIGASINTFWTGQNLNIGSSNGLTENFKGEIDEVRIWSSQRTACEIASYRNTQLVGNETGLLAYYNFNQGFAGETNVFETSLTDLTGNQLNGTLNNFTLQTTTSNWVASGADVTTMNTPVDNIPPVLNVPPDVSADCGIPLDPGNLGGNAIATDICDANPIITLFDVKNGAIVTRTWKATDASGNETTGEQIITINDNAPPVTPVLSTLEGETSITAVAPTTTDACAGTITGTTSDPTVYTQQGIHTITWTFDDGNGNTTTADQKVIVDNGQNMVLEFNTSLSAGTTVTLPLNGTVDATINWGDGNIESTTTSANLDHTYAAEGTYTVFISGSLTHFGRSTYPNADKLAKVTNFGDLGITDFSYAFNNASNLSEVPSTLPAGVTNTSRMFIGAENFNQDLNNWDVSNVIDMSGMFARALAFNGNISNWNVSKVANTASMFNTAQKFNQDISRWDVSNVSNMSFMFMNASLFNQDIGSWDVSNVTNMSIMFQYATAFNGNISTWNTTNVTNMNRMFYGAASFNRDLNSWNVGNVTNMDGIFGEAPAFNGNISAWNTAKVTYMGSMFYLDTSFNQDLSSWDVSNVTDMRNMFRGATSFDQNISNWDVSNVTDMTDMFLNVTLSTTNYDALLNALSALALQENVSFHAGNSKYSCFSESARTDLINDLNWDITDGGKVNDAITINTQPAASTDICESAPETVLTVVASSLFPVSYQWYKDDVIIATEGNNSSFTIPTSFANSGTYYCVLSNTCGVYEQTNDAVLTINDDVTAPETPVLPTIVGEYSVTATAPTTTDACVGTITGTTSDPTEYTVEGTYTITWTFNDGKGNSTTADQTVVVNDGQNMVLEFNTNLSAGTTITLPLNGTVDVSVDWGDGSSESTTNSANLSHTYSSEGTYFVTISGTLTHFGRDYYPNADKLKRVISFGSIEIADLSSAFHYAKNLSEVPSTLPTGVTNTNSMFLGAETFNQDLNNWDVSNVTDMEWMFCAAYAFNGNISDWNVGQVTSMKRMLGFASVFNGNISNWDVSNVTNMYEMFYYAYEFNQDIGNWNTSSVTDMSRMFSASKKFNQDLNNWNTSSVTTLAGIFSDTEVFNGNISSWDVSNVTSLYGLFQGALMFNGDISGWDVSKVTDMSYAFAYTDSFNQDISSWNVGNVTSMSHMFSSAQAFDQDVSKWDVSNVTDMFLMFSYAVSFDQDISSWDVSSVTNMNGMFSGVTLSTINYDALLNAWSTLTLHNGLIFHGGNSKYSCLSVTARDILRNDYKWIIFDGGFLTDAVTINIQPASSTSVNENTPDIELSVGASGEVALSYQWYKDDVAITSNGNSSSLIIITLPANSGTYYCVVTSACGASEQSADAVVDIMDATLNNPTIEESPITIYPNPVSDKLYIEIKSNTIQKITIWNLEGKQLIQKSNDSISGLLDVSFLESGVYIMNIQTNDKIIITKIIKE
ncbi:BspA family leucine-rich repeat surface protein [Mariniflexile sp. HMF6888]|uniref:BspA family leucine-rich repeat surface protein n=1 Tax=Mariniflexile sp. HMF6888 TaxID=3373086 RepID=UPI0037B37D09